MPTHTDLTDALLALIPEDGSRLSNEQLRAALAEEADEPFSDEEFEAAKDHVVAMGAAEKARGPGGGLKAPSVSPPPRPAPTFSNGRGRRTGTGAAASGGQPTIAPGNTAASVLTGELRNQIDGIWNAFWSGGIANPLEVLEQLTYLLFIRRLDELVTLEERKAQRTGQTMARRLFPEGVNGRGRPYEQLRWSRFKELAAGEMDALVGESLFPFLRELGGDGSAYAGHMKDARFTIPTPALLAKVVSARCGADGRPQHQGRHLRIHARQAGHRRHQWPVPHTAPHHRADGGNDRAGAHRCDG